MALTPKEGLNLLTGKIEPKYASSASLLPKPGQIRLPASARTSLSGSEEKPQRTQQEPAASSRQSVTQRPDAPAQRPLFTQEEQKEINNMRAAQILEAERQRRAPEEQREEEMLKGLTTALKGLSSAGSMLRSPADRIIDEWQVPTARGTPRPSGGGTPAQQADSAWSCANGLPGVDGED